MAWIGYLCVFSVILGILIWRLWPFQRIHFHFSEIDSRIVFEFRDTNISIHHHIVTHHFWRMVHFALPMTLPALLLLRGDRSLVETGTLWGIIVLVNTVIFGMTIFMHEAIHVIACTFAGIPVSALSMEETHGFSHVGSHHGEKQIHGAVWALIAPSLLSISLTIIAAYYLVWSAPPMLEQIVFSGIMTVNLMLLIYSLFISDGVNDYALALETASRADQPPRLFRFLLAWHTVYGSVLDLLRDRLILGVISLINHLNWTRISVTPANGDLASVDPASPFQDMIKDARPLHDVLREANIPMSLDMTRALEQTRPPEADGPLGYLLVSHIKDNEAIGDPMIIIYAPDKEYRPVKAACGGDLDGRS